MERRGAISFSARLPRLHMCVCTERERERERARARSPFSARLPRLFFPHFLTYSSAHVSIRPHMSAYDCLASVLRVPVTPLPVRKCSSSWASRSAPVRVMPAQRRQANDYMMISQDTKVTTPSVWYALWRARPLGRRGLSKGEATHARTLTQTHTRKDKHTHKDKRHYERGQVHK